MDISAKLFRSMAKEHVMLVDLARNDLGRTCAFGSAEVTELLGFGGNMDTCIAIRTMVRRGEKVTVQAGAGIVYDSLPEMEYLETENKARALFRALERAGEKRLSR